MVQPPTVFHTDLRADYQLILANLKVVATMFVCVHACYLQLQQKPKTWQSRASRLCPQFCPPVSHLDHTPQAYQQQYQIHAAVREPL